MDKFLKIDGGIGRCIAATGVIENYAKNELEKGNKTFIVTSFPKVFNGLEGIERIYPIVVISENKVIAPPYLYEDYISKGEFIEPEPYNDFSYYKDDKHLVTVFNKLLNGKLEYISPKLILTDNELLEAKTFIENEKTKTGKKFLLYQNFKELIL